jgi:hypothetical protein
MVRIGFELAPQAAHQRIDRPVHRVETPTTRGTDQALSGHDLPRVPRQCVQEVELGGREGNDLPGFIGEAPASSVQQKPSERHRLGHRHRTTVAHAAQQIANSRQKLALVDRFCDVVIRAVFQAKNTIDLVVSSRDQDDADLRFRA